MKTFLSFFKIILFIHLLLHGFSFVTAQNIEIFGDRMPYEKKEINEILNKYRKAEDLFNQGVEGKYYLALEYYFEAYDLNPNSALLNYKLGRCYIHATSPEKSLYYLRRADSLQPNIRNDMSFYLGQALHYNYRFDAAIQKYTFYKLRLSPESLDSMQYQIEKKIAECRNGNEFITSPKKAVIHNLGRSVNSKYHDYCGVLSADESFLAFTSRRPWNIGGSINQYDYLPFEDIYFSHSYGGAWTTAENPGRPLNTRRHDATAEISADGKILSLYHNRNLYQTNFGENNKWSRPKRLSSRINYENFLQYSASYSADRKTIYFVSNRDNGFGGSDIFKSTIDSLGFWSEAENLGPVINSPYDEDGVFLLNDSVLYFSSKGHNSMGEYDLFVSHKTPKGWSEPENLGFPANSPSNDLYIYFTPSGMAYISSDRSGGLGAMDIYSLNFNPTDEEWQKMLAVLPKSEESIRKADSAGQVNINNQVNNVTVDSVVIKDAQIVIQSSEKPVKETVVIENIYFDFDKFNLTRESVAILDRIAALMKDNPTWELIIMGHTDNLGNDPYNQQLSVKRSEAAYDYLVYKGVQKERMMYAGFSFNKPAVNNEIPENRALNRRVEFRLLR